jgi:hypothetical protein
VLPVFGVVINATQATWVTMCFFVISTLRAYLIRRLFNRLSN